MKGFGVILDKTIELFEQKPFEIVLIKLRIRVGLIRKRRDGFLHLFYEVGQIPLANRIKFRDFHRLLQKFIDRRSFDMKVVF